jgi:hypothetical protein
MGRVVSRLGVPSIRLIFRNTLRSHRADQVSRTNGYSPNFDDCFYWLRRHDCQHNHDYFSHSRSIAQLGLHSSALAERCYRYLSNHLHGYDHFNGVPLIDGCICLLSGTYK